MGSRLVLHFTLLLEVRAATYPKLGIESAACEDVRKMRIVAMLWLRVGWHGSIVAPSGIALSLGGVFTQLLSFASWQARMLSSSSCDAVLQQHLRTNCIAKSRNLLSSKHQEFGFMCVCSICQPRVNVLSMSASRLVVFIARTPPVVLSLEAEESVGVVQSIDRATERNNSVRVVGTRYSLPFCRIQR